MIQAQVSLVTAHDETETISLFLLDLINHLTYGTAEEHMLSTDLPETVEKAPEYLQNHTSMMALKTSETPYCGMPAPSPKVCLPEDIYQWINNILYQRLKRRDANTNQIHNDNKRNMQRGTGRARRGKGKSPNQHTSPKPESKLNLDSGACTSIINFLPANATQITNLELIIAANGPIFRTHK